ncbi:hypothetical protein Hanom_Chr08g00685121 [Helianthus anomalus]
MVVRIVNTTPPAYTYIINSNEPAIYPVTNAAIANTTSIICISCSATFCPCQSIC